MPDKLTDAEIKKALETLLQLVMNEGRLRRTQTISLALDLINRQEEEIERLNNRKNVYDFAECRKNEIKAEAHKELVNKIKVHAYYIDFPKEHRVVDEDDIDNLLKELVGDK